MHDYWIGFQIIKYGIVSNIKEPLIQYRIHESNTLGVKIIGISSFITNFKIFILNFILMEMGVEPL